jgi:hypothetical protein
MGRTTVNQPTQGNGYAPLVAAHSIALEKLSGDIAGAVNCLRCEGDIEHHHGDHVVRLYRTADHCFCLLDLSISS